MNHSTAFAAVSFSKKKFGSFLFEVPASIKAFFEYLKIFAARKEQLQVFYSPDHGQCQGGIGLWSYDDIGFWKNRCFQLSLHARGFPKALVLKLCFSGAQITELHFNLCQSH